MSVGLLLHLHQPDYRDPATGVPLLPWTRLHALRAYRDLPWLIRRTGAKVTLNLVPSLLDQLDHYAAGGTDPWLEAVRHGPGAVPPGRLRNELVHRLLLGSPRRLAWFPGLAALHRRQLGGDPFTAEQDLRDAFVWSMLPWFGFSALHDWPRIRELRRKGLGFDEEELGFVLDVQRAVLGGLRGLYQGLPEVSASPYFHPILPLLADTAVAREALPGVPDVGFRHPEDALAQLVEGRARVEAWTGAKVEGLWPSEGSVSPAVLPLVEQAGFRWLCTDEGVLARSEGEDHTRPGRRAPHRGPWTAGGLRLLFRDHAASDRIGFVYADWDGVAAARDLLSQLPDQSLLALDGENPWEAYEDAGEALLTALFSSERVVTVGTLARGRSRGRITRLHAGSWVDGTFHIWYGHPEDRRGWELLRDAREAWEERGRPPAARPHLMAAEGSDWFWWFGDDFHTPVAETFDALFRAHLAAAWRAMGLPVPSALGRPVRERDGGDHPPRAALVAPPRDDWYTWSRAGRLVLRGGAMASGRSPELRYARWQGEWWVEAGAGWQRLGPEGGEVEVGERRVRVPPGPR